MVADQYYIRNSESGRISNCCQMVVVVVVVVVVVAVVVAAAVLIVSPGTVGTFTACANAIL